jgi:hypothetical protein
MPSLPSFWHTGAKRSSSLNPAVVAVGDEQAHKNLKPVRLIGNAYFFGRFQTR